MYWGMWALAQKADSEFSDKLPYVFTDDYPYYDSCGRGGYLQVTGYSLTGWSVILAYASILYLLLKSKMSYQFFSIGALHVGN